ncbi:MAG: GntR family transcriptional regulator [Eubacteriaceae bacterium]|jgi:DNA-binding GntR family transcriptional regulator|nr:GntR family transcriptional regulator [Eubacteriaceae bacterium]MDK2904868.1 GntR family transcriptional regulator [Eubacteriaceae bacterium]MDK2937353.1 GntR family transcriptional regulator [Eubacteriaceae bacterium]MDK2961998.1 GntR family transcriptional regulator [Eubacteriaceae bacterium]MDN5307728.1 GntR family transcriptional regulator [Eubacteriaceae bacterium]
MATRIQDIIMNDLLEKIQNRTLTAGEKLPTNNELAKIYQTSAVTVRKSIAALVSKGYLESVERVGTFVKDRDHSSFQIRFSPSLSINEEITGHSVDDVILTLCRIKGSRSEQKSLQYKEILYADSIPIGFHILTVFINGHPDMKTIENRIEQQLKMFMRIIDSFDVKKEVEVTMDSPSHSIQEKLLVDETTPMFCFTLSYLTKNNRPFGKSVYYIAGENIELHGKSVNG